MQYVLGNMLNGAGGLNPDGLALDLQFAADKTLTARKGPTPVFTRASTATFVGSNGLIQSAAVNAARFDHTSAGVCRGLLIEESRTNFLQRSEEFANLYWTAVRATVTTNAATSPDGATTAEKLIADTTAAINHRVDRPTITLALNTVHTVSIFAKADEYTGLALGVGLSATEGVRFSLVGAGTATPVAAGKTGTIQQLPNGWYRCTCTFTSDATTATHRVAIYVGQNGTTTSYTGDGTSGIFIWGAQLEAGSFATSYIPTVASSVVRSADVCSISGGGFTSFYNNDQGTMVTVASANGLNPSLVNAVAGIESGATPVMRVFYRAAQGNRLSAQISGVISTPASNYNTANVVYKSAITADSAGADYVIDGTQIPDTFTGSVLTADNLKFAGMSGSASNTTISSFRYYRKRLPVSKLQAITA